MDMNSFKSDGNTTDLKAKEFLGKVFKLIINKVDTVTYEANDQQPEQTKAVLYFEGKEKRLVLNGSNTEILCSAFTSEGESWVGKEIQLSTKDYSENGYPPGWIVTPVRAEGDFDDDIPF